MEVKRVKFRSWAELRKEALRLEQLANIISISRTFLVSKWSPMSSVAIE